MKRKSASNKNKEAVMNLPNIITILRLIIAIISFGLMLIDRWTSAFILISVAVMLDIVDGKVARGLNQVTTQGIFFDIMVDKIVIISTFLIIGLKISRIFFYLGILMLIREYIIDTLRSIAASKGKVITSDKLSKIKGILFHSAMLLMILNHAFNHTYTAVVVRDAATALAIAGMVLAYITLVRFIRSYKAIVLE